MARLVLKLSVFALLCVPILSIDAYEEEFQSTGNLQCPAFDIRIDGELQIQDGLEFEVPRKVFQLCGLGFHAGIGEAACGMAKMKARQLLNIQKQWACPGGAEAEGMRFSDCETITRNGEPWSQIVLQEDLWCLDPDRSGGQYFDLSTK